MQTTASRPSLPKRPLFSESEGVFPTTNILRQLGALSLESVEPIILAAVPIATGSCSSVSMVREV
jgi:hypothetical protein